MQIRQQGPTDYINLQSVSTHQYQEVVAAFSFAEKLQTYFCSKTDTINEATFGLSYASSLNFEESKILLFGNKVKASFVLSWVKR